MSSDAVTKSGDEGSVATLSVDNANAWNPKVPNNMAASIFPILITPLLREFHYLNHQFVSNTQRLARSEALFATTYSAYSNLTRKKALLPSGLATEITHSLPGPSSSQVTPFIAVHVLRSLEVSTTTDVKT